MRSHPAKHGEGFDAPPTLERSGSEHRVGRFPSSSLRGEDQDERWTFLKGKEGRVGFRKNFLWLKILQMSAMKVCFQIAECS